MLTSASVAVLISVYATLPILDYDPLIERQEFAAVRKLFNSRGDRDVAEAVKAIAGSPLDQGQRA